MLIGKIKLPTRPTIKQSYTFMIYKTFQVVWLCFINVSSKRITWSFVRNENAFLGNNFGLDI